MAEILAYSSDIDAAVVRAVEQDCRMRVISAALRGAFMWQFSTDLERNASIKASFRGHYQGIGFDDPEVLGLAQSFQALSDYRDLVARYSMGEEADTRGDAQSRLRDRIMDRD
jgi:hypothetical protein